MSDEKYVGPIAAAKIAALVKANLNKKLDKTGGTVTGSLEINGDMHAGGAVQSDLLLSAPSVAVHNDAAEASVYINCSGDNAARITSLGSDGKPHCARLAVGAPTGDNDAATKAYVDGRTHDYYDVTVDAALDASSTNPVQNKAVKAALDKKLSTSGNGSISGGLTLDGGISVGHTKTYTGVHLYKDSEGVAKLTSGSADVDDTITLARLKVASPTEDDDAATKAYVDSKAAGVGSVRYDAKQALEGAQKLQARQNIGAVSEEYPQLRGFVTLAPANGPIGTGVGLSVTQSPHNFELNITDVNEGEPTLLTGVKTPTDANTNAAATVEYVKNKVSEVAASGGVDVDNALSATSTNPVQNKVVTAALTGKAGTAVATQSANGLMSKADKTKLDGIEAGAMKVTVDSAMSASSTNPVQNKVVKQYVDDKVAAAGSNITVDAALSATSTNPVQNKAVKAAVDAKADKTALDGKLDKAGGTLTGNLVGEYITGTWLQSTAAADLGKTPGKIAVLDDSGWVYYRTPAELLADIGGMSGGDYYTKAETDAAIAVRASTSAYGTTKLSNSITSSRKTVAATPYAIKTALAQAKAYVDSAIAVAINSAY